MPDSPIFAPLESLRQSIEALALEVALRDLSSPERIQPLAPMLVAVRQAAEAAGMTAVAETASTFVGQIESGPGAIEQALRDAVSRMQQLIAEPAPQPQAPGLPQALNQDPELIAD